MNDVAMGVAENSRGAVGVLVTADSSVAYNAALVAYIIEIELKTS